MLETKSAPYTIVKQGIFFFCEGSPVTFPITTTQAGSCIRFARGAFRSATPNA